MFRIRESVFFLTLFFLSYSWSGEASATSTNKASSPASSRNFIYSGYVDVSIKKRRGGYLLEKKMTVSNLYQTDRASEVDTYYFHVPAYVSLDQVWALPTNNMPQVSYYYPDDTDSFISDTKIYSIRYRKKLKPGQAAVYSYTTSFKDPVYLSFVQIPRFEGMEKFIINVHHMNGMRVDFDVFAAEESVQPTDTYKSSRRAAIAFERFPQAKHLYGDPYNTIFASVMIRLNNAQGEAVTPHTPQDFYDWYSWYVNLKRPYKSLPRELAGLVNSQKSELEKAEALNRYLAENIRYIADERKGHEFIPRGPPVVVRDGYGDCKDKSFLAAALGKHLGLNISMALVQTEVQSPHKFIHLYNYNHAICHMLHEGKDYFFDPTAENYSFFALPYWLRGKDVLVLEPDNPHVVEAPALPEEADFELIAKVSSRSLKKVKAYFALRHDGLAYLKYQLHGNKKRQAVSALSAYLADKIYNVSFKDFEFFKKEKNLIILSAVCDFSDLFIRTSRGLYIPKKIFRVHNSLIFEQDKSSTWLSTGKTFSYFVRIEFQDIDRLEGTDVKMALPEKASYEVSSSSSGDKAVLAYTYKNMQLHYSPREKAEFLSFCRQYQELNSEMFYYGK